MRIGDIDIDVADRKEILKLFKHRNASMTLADGTMRKHNTGVYFCDIPHFYDTLNSTIDYNKAEEIGYMKIDIINNSVYKDIQTTEELHCLMHTTPDWNSLDDKSFFERVVHINSQWKSYCELKEKIRSVNHMAMFLAIIRPGKRHLIGKSWNFIEKEVWLKPESDEYYYKKGHAISYAYTVVIHMNKLLSGRE